MIQAAATPAQPSPGEASADPVVRRYRAFFALLEWSQVTERDAERRWPGRLPHPRVAYVKALLVKLCEQKAYITDLRRFLVDHPALVLELGFHPKVTPTEPAGFDPERTVPCARWLRHQQQHLEHGLLRALLAGTVRTLQTEIPGLGTTVAVDVKHIYAGSRRTIPKRTSPTATIPSGSRTATWTAAWASSGAPTRNVRTARPPCARSSSGATGPA